MMSVNKLIIALLSVISIFLLTISFFLDSESELYKLLNLYDYGLCIFFLYDFFAELRRSKNRWKYFFTYGWLDLLSSIPVIHELRFARAFRVFRVFRIFKSYKILVNFLKSNKKESFYGFSVMFIILSIITSSFLVLYFEHESGNITTAEETLWWSFVTITTVGYGDLYPVTTFGRIFASILIITGIFGFGAVISYLNDLVKKWR
ncbi:MAG: potassium channel family protein [Bacteroidetes bacterium]|nr:potassium channel family protein [Bacteroidota bacterium]